MSKTVSLDLAREVLGYRPETLDAADVEQAKRLILDWCGVTTQGTTTPWGRMVHDWAMANAGPGRARLAGSGQTRAAAAAALVNGTAAHGYELDDNHDPSMGHCGSVVITAAMAVAGQVGAPSAAVIPAVVAGYEAMARVGRAGNIAEMVKVGFHPTASFGMFGAAAAAAHLMGLTPEQLAMAWGIGLSTIAGTQQFAEEPKGTMVKRMHSGLPAQNGILAAELAALGITGPMQAIEGRYGFLALYGRQPRPEMLVKAPGAPLEIHTITVKPYACCRKFHSLIDALAEATGGGTLDPAAVEAITVHSPLVSLEQHQLRRPDSVMAAQYSMPYIVGATLAYGPSRFDAYETAHHTDPAILGLIDRIEARRDPSFEPVYPEHMGNAVEIRMADGRVLGARVADGLGSPYKPIDRAGLRAKAATLMAMADPGIDPDAVEAAIWSLEAADSVDALMRLLMVDRH